LVLFRKEERRGKSGQDELLAPGVFKKREKRERRGKGRESSPGRGISPAVALNVIGSPFEKKRKRERRGGLYLAAGLRLPGGGEKRKGRFLADFQPWAVIPFVMIRLSNEKEKKRKKKKSRSKPSQISGLNPPPFWKKRERDPRRPFSETPSPKKKKKGGRRINPSG